MRPRTTQLAVGAGTFTSNVPQIVYTVPDGKVTIVKSIYLATVGTAQAYIAGYVQFPVGGSNAYVLPIAAYGTLEVRPQTLYVVMNEGDGFGLVAPTTGAISYILSGSELDAA